MKLPRKTGISNPLNPLKIEPTREDEDDTDSPASVVQSEREIESHSCRHQVSETTSEYCANCNEVFSVSEGGRVQAKEFNLPCPVNGELTNVCVWKAVSLIFQLRLRMYNNIHIATAFCLGEDGNRDLALCTKCALTLRKLYKFYTQFIASCSDNSYISKLISENEMGVSETSESNSATTAKHTNQSKNTPISVIIGSDIDNTNETPKNNSCRTSRKETDAVSKPPAIINKIPTKRKLSESHNAQELSRSRPRLL